MLRWLRSKKGFTLAEVLLGIVIISYVLLVVAKLFNSITIAAKTSEFGTLASNYGRAKMEDLKNRNYDEVPSGTWTPDVWVVDASQALGQKGILNFTRSVKVYYVSTIGGVLVKTDQTTDTGLKQVEVKVEWEERGQTRTMDLISLIARGV